MMSHSNEWRAQQSLFMGSSTPIYHRQVSMSPQDHAMPTILGPQVSPLQSQSIETLTPSSGRVMYPSTVYHYGNPGYYYDSLQYPVSSETQTTPRLLQYNTGFIPTYDTSPPPVIPTTVHNSIPHGTTSTSLGYSQMATPLSSVVTTTSVHNLDHPLDDDSISNNNNISQDYPNNNNSTHGTYVPSSHDVGCQFTSHTLVPPVTMVKEVKKLTLPTFDPTKMSRQSFAMKMHASLIECDLAYLLQEESTTQYNATHSKELMLELFKKLQVTALSLFTRDSDWFSKLYQSSPASPEDPPDWSGLRTDISWYASTSFYVSVRSSYHVSTCTYTTVLVQY
jgi:hypothetical protein